MTTVHTPAEDGTRIAVLALGIRDFVDWARQRGGCTQMRYAHGHAVFAGGTEAIMVSRPEALYGAQFDAVEETSLFRYLGRGNLRHCARVRVSANG